MVSDHTWALIKRRQAGHGQPWPAAGAAPLQERSWVEGYGPAGTAVLVRAVTPAGTSTRTSATSRDSARAQIGILFKQHGGHLGAPGSVAYLFRQAGVISYPPPVDRERLAQLAYAAGAEDVTPDASGGMEVLTAPACLAAVSAHLSARGAGAPADQRVLWRAHSPVRLMGEDARRMLQLLLALERRDDVESVYSNAEIPDEIVAEL